MAQAKFILNAINFSSSLSDRTGQVSSNKTSTSNAPVAGSAALALILTSKHLFFYSSFIPYFAAQKNVLSHSKRAGFIFNFLVSNFSCSTLQFTPEFYIESQFLTLLEMMGDENDNKRSEADRNELRELIVANKRRTTTTSVVSSKTTDEDFALLLKRICLAQPIGFFFLDLNRLITSTSYFRRSLKKMEIHSAPFPLLQIVANLEVLEELCILNNDSEFSSMELDGKARTLCLLEETISEKNIRSSRRADADPELSRIIEQKKTDLIHFHNFDWDRFFENCKFKLSLQKFELRKDFYFQTCGPGHDKFLASFPNLKEFRLDGGNSFGNLHTSDFTAGDDSSSSSNICNQPSPSSKNRIIPLHTLELSSVLRLNPPFFENIILPHINPQTLTRVIISNNLPLSDQSLALLFRKMKNLRFIELNCFARVSDETFFAIAENCSILQSLRLGFDLKARDSGLTEEALVKLANSQFLQETLLELRLDGTTSVSVGGLAHLQHFRNLETLEIVNFNSASMSLEGIRNLTNNGDTSVLQNLRVLKLQISPFSVQRDKYFVGPLSNLKSLKTLDTSTLFQFKAKNPIGVVDKLKNAIPGLEII